MIHMIGSGLNYDYERLIEIEVRPESKLFRIDSLPLLAGRYHIGTETYPQDHKSLVMPDGRGVDEPIAEYIGRVQDFNEKMSNLNQWFITTQSNNEEEDSLIISQLNHLNNLSDDDLASVLELCEVGVYKPCIDGSTTADAVKNIINSLLGCPTQIGPGALRLQQPGGSPGRSLGSIVPKSFDGFGVRICTWDCGNVCAIYLGGCFYWVEASYPDEAGCEEDNLPEIITEVNQDIESIIARHKLVVSK